jgi:hypothetical protein
VRLLLALVASALLGLAVGCGGGDERPTPPTLPPSALPELSSEARELDREALAADALQPGALAELLDEAGYVSGREREFFGHGASFDRVVARSLRFESTEGADRYIRWVRTHPRDLLGEAEERPRLELGSSGVLLTLVPCGTCKKELPTHLAAWRRRDVVLSLLASGRGANPERFAALARRLDARMET